MIASYKGVSPVIHAEAFVAPTAVIKKQLNQATSKPYQQPAKNYLGHAAGHCQIEILQK